MNHKLLLKLNKPQRKEVQFHLFIIIFFWFLFEAEPKPNWIFVTEQLGNRKHNLYDINIYNLYEETREEVFTKKQNAKQSKSVMKKTC